MRKRIFALCGDTGTRLEEAMEKILTMPNVGPVKKYTNNKKIAENEKYTSYISDIDYIIKVSNGEIIEATVDNDKNVIGSWLPDGYNTYVGIFSKEAIDTMQDEDINDIFIIELITKDEIRLKRLIKKYGAKDAAKIFYMAECNKSNITFYRDGISCLKYRDDTSSRKFKGLLSLLDNFVK